MKDWQSYIFKFFIFWYICGVVLVGFDILPSWLEWSNSVFIITSGILGWIYIAKLYGQRNGSIISVLIFISTFTIEYFGSSVSFLFGDYTYTNQFAPNVFGVPIAIGFAWVMVIATGLAFLQYFQLKMPITRAFIGGLLALFMDLVLDPVAYQAKQYWIWHEPGYYYDIPWTNFFGWFIIAFFIHLFLSFVKNIEVSTIWHNRLMLMYCLIVAMFALIALLTNLYLASVIGFIIASLIGLIVWWRKGHKHDLR